MAMNTVIPFGDLKKECAKVNQIKIGKGKEAKLLIDELGLDPIKISVGCSYKSLRAGYLEFFERLAEKPKFQKLVQKKMIALQNKLADEEASEDKDEGSGGEEKEKKTKKAKKGKKTKTETKKEAGKEEKEADPLEAMTKTKEVKKFAKEQGLSVKVKKKMDVDEAKTLVREAMSGTKKTGAAKKKTTTAAKTKKAGKKKQPVNRDKYGFKEGTLNSLFADAISKKSMTMAQAKEADWNTKGQTFYDCFKTLKDKGLADRTEDKRMYIVGSRAAPKKKKGGKKK